MCLIVTIGHAQEKTQNTEQDVDSVDKRLLLHSPDDLLDVVMNLTAQVKALNVNQEHLVANLTAQVNLLNNSLAKKGIQLSKLEAQMKHQRGGGSTYIRWGRKSCPANGTNTVYSGYAGGSLYANTGAAANYICLSPTPTWDHYTDAVDSLARVYGAEYEFFHAGKPGDNQRHKAFFNGRNLIDNNVPCSVCETDRSKILMIPGQNYCNAGWTLEYKGYLSAGYYEHPAATEYVCMDADPEFIIGGQNNDNGALFYFAEASCGSLECPPYKNGRELTCAVCSK